MKRTVTILLLAVFLLNVVGFYGIFLGLKFSSSRSALKAVAENRFSQEQAVTFAIPLNVPYYTDQSGEYQRVDGEFEHGGEVYRLVKQKLQRDTLYVVCIKDHATKSINDAMADYVKNFTDKPVSEKSSGAKSIPSLIKDYVSTAIALKAEQNGWNTTITFEDCNAYNLLSSHSEIESPPRV